MSPPPEVVVVGAGQAGLAVSYHLRAKGFDHLVLERRRVGESWRSQRWDSFVVNTPNWMNGLPGAPYQGESPDSFMTRDQLVESFERYVARFELPLHLGVTVTSVERPPGASRFLVRTDAPGLGCLEADNVVVASGLLRAPKVPAVSADLPPDVVQLHAGQYRNAAHLPPGAVLVVGSAQSGCQIAEELLAAGRQVYLCVSRVGRVPPAISRTGDPSVVAGHGIPRRQSRGPS